MKKIISISFIFLVAMTLAACTNNNSSVQSKTEESKAASSSVKNSSKESSSSSDSSTSSSVNLETPDFVLATDEEIDNARTIGDLKALYSKVADNYIKYSNEIREKLPASGKVGFDQEAGDSLKALEESKQTFSDQLSQYGSDDMEIPEENRNPYLQRMKETRDKMTNILKVSYIMASNLSKKE